MEIQSKFQIVWVHAMYRNCVKCENRQCEDCEDIRCDKIEWHTVWRHTACLCDPLYHILQCFPNFSILLVWENSVSTNRVKYEGRESVLIWMLGNNGGKFSHGFIGVINCLIMNTVLLIWKEMSSYFNACQTNIVTIHVLMIIFLIL